MATTLALNYAVYLPNTDQNYSTFNKEALPAFIISMLLVVLGLITTCFIVINAKTSLAKERKYPMNKGFFSSLFVGLLGLFGVGAFAPTISISNTIGLIEDDKKIPGTLNAGYVLPIILQALIMISVIKVDILTLIVLIIAAVIGSYIGAAVANKVNKLFIKTAMAVVLFISALLMLLSHPSVALINSGEGVTGFSLSDLKFYIATFAFLILGALMSFGVGLYAPALAVISLLGMDGGAAYPIMMGACAFLMPVSTFKFVKDKNYVPKLSVSLMIGGILGNFISFLVLFMGIKYGLGLSEVEFKKILLWIVIIVIFYSSVTMFLDSVKAIRKNQEIKFNNLKSVYK
ncbi:sulfite exporter TauE/SafE family protein [Spiroplasma floricola]|uniref:Probable membrane transporter protein n=1 Tax=Spiroplasma floricola 23-6 TaxID=1336749 RepID=A0A2K8SF51_9MOLU|nr:TSUP family transporter [Spiroplasma floricola]AUB32066.1 hypothetical protein SFLOR_v1c10200 [Spiroplasma floricola 23-6]